MNKEEEYINQIWDKSFREYQKVIKSTLVNAFLNFLLLSLVPLAVGIYVIFTADTIAITYKGCAILGTGAMLMGFATGFLAALGLIRLRM